MASTYKGYTMIRKEEERKNKVFVYLGDELIMRRISLTSAMRSIDARKIKQNTWGNWRGYLGSKAVAEFGGDEIAAGHWLLTGVVDFNEAYSDENMESARKAANES